LVMHEKGWLWLCVRRVVVATLRGGKGKGEARRERATEGGDVCACERSGCGGDRQKICKMPVRSMPCRSYDKTGKRKGEKMTWQEKPAHAWN